MNKFDEKVIEWSEQEFNVKLNSKESLNLFRAKNGTTFKKLLNFMSDRIKSKENGESIKRFCDSYKCKTESKAIKGEIEEIESKISCIRNQLIGEEVKRKSIELTDNLNENKAFVSKLVLNVIEKISAKNKLWTQLEPNLIAINDTIQSFERLFTPFGDIESENSGSYGQTLSISTNSNCGQLLDQINQRIESIDSILYDLNRLEVIKPIFIEFDSQLLFKGLSESKPIIEVENEKKEVKNREIASKLLSIQKLMTKYETNRSETLNKNKEKLEKVINSCDEFIQQKRLKCLEK